MKRDFFPNSGHAQERRFPIETTSTPDDCFALDLSVERKRCQSLSLANQSIAAHSPILESTYYYCPDTSFPRSKESPLFRFLVVGKEAALMEEQKEALLITWPVTKATQPLWRSSVEDTPTAFPASAKPYETDIVLGAFNPLLADTASTLSAAVASSHGQARGAQLLRNFLHRRRLGLVKTGRGPSTADKDFVYSVDEATSEGTAGLRSAGRSGVAREIRERGTDHHAITGDAAFCDPVCAAPATVSTGTTVPGSGVGVTTRGIAVADNDVTSATAGDCSPQSRRRPTVPTEKQINGVSLVTQENSVEVVLRPFFNLRLQLAPAAAALETATNAPAASPWTRASGGPPVARVDVTPEAGVGARDMCRIDCEKLDPHLRDFGTWGRVKSTASTLSAKLWTENSVTDKHVPSMITESFVPAEKSSVKDDTSVHPAKGSAADADRHHTGVQGGTDSSCASYYGQSSRNLQLPREHQNVTRPRPFCSAEEETYADIEQHHIWIEQQREAVATAEAEVAVLRRTVRALQAENDRLVSTWVHGRTRRQGHDKLGKVACNATSGISNHSDPAGAGTTEICQSSLDAHDELQILKQQLAICQREVYLLSQENENLRDLCNTKTF